MQKMDTKKIISLYTLFIALIFIIQYNTVYATVPYDDFISTDFQSIDIHKDKSAQKESPQDTLLVDSEEDLLVKFGLKYKHTIENFSNDPRIVRILVLEEELENSFKAANDKLIKTGKLLDKESPLNPSTFLSTTPSSSGFIPDIAAPTGTRPARSFTRIQAKNTESVRVIDGQYFRGNRLMTDKEAEQFGYKSTTGNQVSQPSTDATKHPSLKIIDGQWHWDDRPLTDDEVEAMGYEVIPKADKGETTSPDIVAPTMESEEIVEAISPQENNTLAPVISKETYKEEELPELGVIYNPLTDNNILETPSNTDTTEPTKVEEVISPTPQPQIIATPSYTENELPELGFVEEKEPTIENTNIVEQTATEEIKPTVAPSPETTAPQEKYSVYIPPSTNAITEKTSTPNQALSPKPVSTQVTSFSDTPVSPGAKIVKQEVYVNGQLVERKVAADYDGAELLAESVVETAEAFPAATKGIADEVENTALEEVITEVKEKRMIVDGVLYINGLTEAEWNKQQAIEAGTFVEKTAASNEELTKQIEDLINNKGTDAAASSSSEVQKFDIRKVDGEYYVNGKPASTQEVQLATKINRDPNHKATDLTQPGVVFSYATSYDPNTHGHKHYTSDLHNDEKGMYKILMTNTSGAETIPCHSHYDHNWHNSKIHAYQFDVRYLPEKVEFILTDGQAGGFVMPIAGRVTSEFGPRWGRHHNGIDLDLNTGDPVMSAFKGKVRIAQYSRSYGYIIVIRHFNGLETFYAHLSKLHVKPGDDVEAGSVIGLGGNTGRSTGSHLHFEVRYKGHPINPRQLIDFNYNSLLSNKFVVNKSYFTSSNPYESAHGHNHSHSHGSSSSSSSSKKYHTVRKGQTLSSIARRHGTSVRKLCKLNRISTRTTLRVGRKLRVR